MWGTTLLEKDWSIKTLLRILQARIVNTNQLIKNISRLPWKNPGSFMRVSILDCSIRSDRDQGDIPAAASSDPRAKLLRRLPNGYFKHLFVLSYLAAPCVS